MGGADNPAAVHLDSFGAWNLKRRSAHIKYKYKQKEAVCYVPCWGRGFSVEQCLVLNKEQKLNLVLNKEQKFNLSGINLFFE